MRTGIRVGLVGLMAATVLGRRPPRSPPRRRWGPEAGHLHGSTWKVKASVDNSRLETEFEVDSNVVAKWKVRLWKRPGLLQGPAADPGPRGSFEVRKFTADQRLRHDQGQAITPPPGNLQRLGDPLTPRSPHEAPRTSGETWGPAPDRGPGPHPSSCLI
jgi:hypothetical protein